MLLLLGIADSAVAADVSYEVINSSTLTLMEFYASPVGEGAWGEDLLYVSVLPSGEAGTVTIVDGRARCDFDLRLVFEDGRERVDKADVCSGPSYRVREAQ
jgi:hypothetical protein